MAETFGAPKPGPHHVRLAAFIGSWHAEGESFGRDQDPDHPRAVVDRWVSDETVQWHPGGFFIIHQQEARIGPMELITHMVIGYDALAGEYVAHSFENHGFYRRYVGHVNGRVWTFGGETERVRFEFDPSGRRQNVVWEWRPQGEAWLPLCERVHVRID